MLIIEILSILFSLISVILLMKGSIHTWSVGLIGIIGYAILFWHNNLYADFILQIIFIFLSIKGYLDWNKKVLIYIKRVNWFKFNTINLLVLLLSSYLFSFTDNPLPYLDSLAATLSIAATYLMIRKSQYTWIYWMIADIVYICIFSYQSMMWSSILYMVFFILAFIGFKNHEKI